MPHESDEASTELFVSQLSVVNSLIVLAVNRDCSIIVGGDVNVDLSRECNTQRCYAIFVIYLCFFPSSLIHLLV